MAQHKLDRKIVREEHWVRYGVTARRKRNMRRMGELQAMREARRTYRGAAGTAAMAASEADLSGKLVVEAKGIGKAFAGRPIVADFSHRLLRGDRLGVVGPNGSGKTTLVEPADRRARTRQRPGPPRRQRGDGERSTRGARASIPTGPWARR